MKFIDIDLTQAIIDEALNEAVAPVAPDPGLREAIAKAAYMAWWDYEKSGDAWGKVADAVLLVLAERGVR